jgi:regulator of protease activity HflC (stomatin/prohibitin superfamily)
VITERESLGRELRRILDEKTNPWGITIQLVEIHDVRIPQAFEDAMSRQTQAERQGRNTLSAGQRLKSPTNSRKPRPLTRHRNLVLDSYTHIIYLKT